MLIVSADLVLVFQHAPSTGIDGQTRVELNFEVQLGLLISSMNVLPINFYRITLLILLFIVPSSHNGYIPYITIYLTEYLHVLLVDLMDADIPTYAAYDLCTF